jgi:hypothetical protein
MVRDPQRVIAPILPSHAAKRVASAMENTMYARVSALFLAIAVLSPAV